MTKHDSKTADELIIDNAPDGVFTAVHNTYSDEWLYSNQCNLRSLADITELVELRKKNAELESHNLGLTKTLVEFEQERAIRDLEQKADALDNFKIPEMSYTVFHKVGDALNEQAEELREQAKQLKGGAK